MIEPRGAKQFPDGAWWVDLAPVTDPDRVPQALAAAAGLSGLTLQGQQAALTKRLQRRRALVVIDNCEHLAAACEELCDGVLPACPGLVILATSRIGLRGGHEFALTAMESHAAQPSTRSAQPSTRTDAVSLFYDRAGLVLSGYAAIARDEATVATICQLLNGLPLAIELAAPWIRTLSATDLLAHLERSLEVLAASDGTVSNRPGSTQADRHRSMRVVLDGTWTWLSEDQRQVLRSLGVFVGRIQPGGGRDGRRSDPRHPEHADRAVAYPARARERRRHPLCDARARPPVRGGPPDRADLRRAQQSPAAAPRPRRRPDRRLHGRPQRARGGPVVGAAARGGGQCRSRGGLGHGAGRNRTGPAGGRRHARRLDLQRLGEPAPQADRECPGAGLGHRVERYGRFACPSGLGRRVDELRAVRRGSRPAVLPGSLRAARSAGKHLGAVPPVCGR